MRNSLKIESPIGIAGTGRVAQALGRLLRERGQPVAAVAGRDPERTRAAAEFVGGIEAVTFSHLPEFASRVLIAVSDAAVTEVAETLARAGMNSGAALHTCGTVGAEALEPLSRAGVSCGALHPLQTVATAEEGLTALHNVAFAIDGEGPALGWAEQIVALLDGRALRIDPSKRVFYHAAAVMASNYAVALMDAAVMLMGAAGIEEETALKALAPLVRASMGNALRLGPSQALTGPIERGDAGTVAVHLRALELVPGQLRGLYRAAGLHALEVARKRGLSETKARELEELLSESECSNG
jgi:predicted short-subunit dehydrogenase-like oxidoreductase (DUF2520 family)